MLLILILRRKTPDVYEITFWKNDDDYDESTAA